MLAEVPTDIWAKSKYDMMIKGCEPSWIVPPKSDYRPYKKQYSLKPEVIKGIKPVFQSFQKTGIIIPCENSLVRTLLFPVKKIRDAGQPDEWRFVQDLQAQNAADYSHAPTVPNPYTILSQIPSDEQFFTVVDLSNAFFSVPVHPGSKFWFAFEFEGRSWNFIRLCQGYRESPTIYNAAVWKCVAHTTSKDHVACGNAKADAAAKLAAQQHHVSISLSL